MVRAVRLEDLPTDSAGPASLRAVRHHLGIHGFGVNVWEAAAGQEVIESHVEAQDSPSRHEELYLVLAGRAEFDVDGETVDAPAGTFVFVPDPQSRRGAVAREDGTRVLTVGAPRDAPFRVSEWERRRFPDEA